MRGELLKGGQSAGNQAAATETGAKTVVRMHGKVPVTALISGGVVWAVAR